MQLLTEEQEHGVDTALHSDDRMIITFQNENLIAELLPCGSSTSKKLLAVVPDLISVLDSQSGSSLGTNEYRYGVCISYYGKENHS